MDEDYEEVGYIDEEDEVGFAFPRGAFRQLNALTRGRRSSPTRRAVRVVRRAAPISRSARTVGRKVAMSGQRRRYLGFGTVSVGAAGTGQLTANLQGPIAAERLIITTDGGAGEVTVSNIRVGTRSQLEGTGAMPVEAFAADATGSALALDPGQTGQDIIIDLANSGAGAAVCSALIIGVTGD